MDLDTQLRDLIQSAPQDGQTPALVEAVAPIFRLLAGRLRHTQYYIVQTLDHDWAITTLESRQEPVLQKNVVYGFPTLKDVSLSPYPMQDPQLIAFPVPVTHVLFRMMISESIDSTIFFETPGNTEAGIEIQRQEVNDLIQAHLQPSATLPPDIA